ncbi:MAG: hypothetical protein COX57_02790 [Alphaproteobacteria bacterium CG_4_10_14_0_2_um_filter_63_37]|nr:MAG: hypothetical protein AUJ55_03260 [Proteobacteria bacterium CG1_02_64_396]PJA25471.1 MAG: hypothetical protein COX57_02790 [Alphaproteobacteria bacterium CG_4_10_14_0_2_um_filter_63_37]
MSDRPPVKRLGLPTRDGKTLKIVQTQEGQPPILTEATPPESCAEARRLKATSAQGVTPSPRAQPLATINTPLETRTRTILYYELSAEEQATLNGGVTPSQNKGRK